MNVIKDRVSYEPKNLMGNCEERNQEGVILSRSGGIGGELMLHCVPTP